MTDKEVVDKITAYGAMRELNGNTDVGLAAILDTIEELRERRDALAWGGNLVVGEEYGVEDYTAAIIDLERYAEELKNILQARHAEDMSNETSELWSVESGQVGDHRPAACNLL
jgi:hypothetical protein